MIFIIKYRVKEQIEKINKQTIKMTLTEGKNRQIRRLIQKIGLHVTRLKRISFGEILLNDLKKGDYRSLTKLEITSFKQH